MKQSRKQWRKKKSICGCWPYLLCMAIMLAAIIPTTAYSAEKKQQATEGNAEEVTVEEASEEQQTEERPSVRATTPGLVVTMAGKGATTADNFNVTMDSNNTTTTTIANSAISSLIATKVQATFPEQATNKQVRVTLAPGMAITNTSANIGSNDANVKEWLNGTITVGAGDKVWDDKTIRMSNSTIIYPFKDSTETVTIPMNVWLQIQTWLFSVGDTAKPAVKVELLADTGDGQGVRAISEVACTTITANPLYPTFTPTQDHELLVAMDTDVAMTSAVTNYEFRINHTLSGQGRYYDSVEWYICVDKEKAVLKGDTMNNFGEVEDLGLDPDDSTKRIYKISLAHGTIGNAPFNLKWNFPSAYFTGGDEITVSTIKVVTKPWGYENTYTYVPGVTDAITNTDADGNITLSRKNLNYTHKFIINSDDLVWVNNSNDTSKPDEDRKGDTARPVHWRNPGFEDMVGILGWYSLGNRKAVDSKPKTVEFHFDSTDIGVTALNIPMPGGKTLSEVQYKIKGDNSWHTATVSLTPTETDPKKLGVVMVTNDSVLGHNIDDYITDFKYVMPYVPANAYITGNDSAVTDKAPHIWGRVLNQMDASKRVKSTIQAYTEGTDPAVTTPFPQNTDIGNIYTDLSETKIGLGISASDTMEQAPNSTFVFSNVTKSPTAEIPNVSPVFYIRDETGCGIEDFSLVNTEGVNLTDTYGIMPELVETTTDATTGKAVLLYKVDTSSIAKNNTGLDKYAAAIGNYVFNGNPDQGIARELTIRYTVTVPTTYRDGSVYHKHQDRVYLSSANKMYDHSLVAGTTIHDPYDVNKDGHITESVAPTTSPYNLVVSNSSTSTYRIYVPPRLNVVTEAKHYNAPEASYTSWQKGEDPLHVNVGMNSGFNVKIRVSNDSSADVTGMKLY